MDESDVISSLHRIHPREEGLISVVTITHRGYGGGKVKYAVMEIAHSIHLFPTCLLPCYLYSEGINFIFGHCSMSASEGSFDEWLRTLVIRQRLRKRSIRQLPSNTEGLPLRSKIQHHQEIPCEDQQEEPSREITEIPCCSH